MKCNITDITAKLNKIDKVLDLVVLDAGNCVVLIISTGGYSTYMPTQGITTVSFEEASIIADSYWHKATFLAKDSAIKASS